ncbi:MAG: endonuclease III [Candidatus Dormiibacterota bacterium]|jgi:endonuclease-3
MASRRRLPRGARERATTVVERLAAEYPDAACALVHDGPLQLLVATILSAQCTDERVNLVTPGLFHRYPDAAAFAESDPAELEELIRSTGFFHTKARAIIAMSQEVVARFGGRVPDRMEDLVTLRGVGRKTANVVLGVAFGKPGFAVDTHVTRLTGRLKLSSSTDPVEIETDVCSMVPAAEWTDLGLRLILHGRQVCAARNPRCPVCVLNDVCPSAQLLGLRTAGSRSRPRGGVVMPTTRASS